MEPLLVVMGHPATEDEASLIGSEADLPLEEADLHDEPWCVDHGIGIEVMSAEAIREGLASGRLRPSLRAWRDGHACWQPIGDFPELMPRDLAHATTGRFTSAAPQGGDGGREGPRRIPPPRPVAPAPASSAIARRGTRAFGWAFATGVLLGLVLFVPLRLADPPTVLDDLEGRARALLAP